MRFVTWKAKNSSLSNFCPSRRKSTSADPSLGCWPATITCFFSDRTAYSVPPLALRRAGLPSCASKQKSDGHQLPYGGPLPEHVTTTLNSFASKQTTGYAAFGSRRGITLSYKNYVEAGCTYRQEEQPSRRSTQWTSRLHFFPRVRKATTWG